MPPAGPADVRSAAHVFVADLDALELCDGDARHLARVLRLRAGERVTVADGFGHWRAAVIPAGFPAVALEPDGPSRFEPAAARLAVAFAMTKGEKPELVVQKLTELGIDEIVLFAAEHSVVRWDDERIVRQGVRLAAVAREAAMQSRRSRLPDIRFSSFLDLACTPGAAIAERGGSPVSAGQHLILVGPEGGWSIAELASGLPRIALGRQVLRAETAAISAAVLMTARRGERL